MTDELEEMAWEFVVMAQSEQGLSQPQECALEILKSLRTLRSKTLEERPPFCIACEPRIEELKILQARIKELENEKHLENIRVVQAARILELEDKLKTIRSKTRKEDAEKIKELRSRIKRIEENSIKLLTTPCIECENLKRELNSPIRLSEKLCKPYEDEIRRLEKEKHEFFDAVVELGKQKEDLIKEIEFLKSSSLLAQEVSMKEEWRNSAVKHAQEILLLKERLSFCVELIKEALKMGYCSAGWDKKAKAILKKEE